MFSRRHPPARRGRHPSAAPTTDGEDAYMADTDTHPPSPTAAHVRARVITAQKLEGLATQVADRIPAYEPQMDHQQIDEALIDLVARLATIRANSDPRVFSELWESHIMRVEELDEEEEAEYRTSEKSDSPTADRDPKPVSQGASQSNEPFMTSGSPLPPCFYISSLIPPSLPSLMSVYLSVSHLPSHQAHPHPTCTPPISHSAATSLTKAYHWPSAPVENHNMAMFFAGVNFRIDAPFSAILGWMFSYGWNDMCRFISTGRFGPHGTLPQINPKACGNGGHTPAMPNNAPNEDQH